MPNYNHFTTDELEAMRDRLQEEIADRFDDERFCNQAEYELDLIEYELEERENLEDYI